MAALAPLAGATIAAGPAPVPLRPLPSAAPPPAPPALSGSSFTAFPSSYGAFGNGESGYGTVGVKNGSLTVVAGSTPPPGDAGAPKATAPAAQPANPAPGAKAGDPPPGDPLPPPPPVATLPPQPVASTPGLQPPNLEGPFPANSQSNSLPGPFANLNQTPDPLQKIQDQEQQAAQAQQQAQANAQETQNQKLTQSLQDVDFRISAANGAGDTAVAQSLAPLATQINGALQNQPFAGIGATPPQPFAKPEIPTVFLNLPA
jgi:hypothetical protein